MVWEMGCFYRGRCGRFEVFSTSSPSYLFPWDVLKWLMMKYKDVTGLSTIDSYEVGENWIKIRFKNEIDVDYTYSSVRPGARHVQLMKNLAEVGGGLSTYISRYIRKNFEMKTESKKLTGPI